MELDLAYRSSKLEADQKRRKEEAQRKRQREAAARERAARQQHEMEEVLRAKRLADAAAAAEDQRRSLEEARLTAGVNFQHQFMPLRTNSEDDKITLPPSALQELEAQGALAHGPMFFRVSIPGSSTYTHCGVREFTESDGIVGLPPKVIDSLTTDAQALSAVIVKYVRLPKCTYARIRPSYNDFSHIGPIRDVLEQNLHLHSTLTVGDKLTVWHRGKSYTTTVMELRPESSCALIDTDVEVDIDVSNEYEQHTEAQLASVPKGRHVEESVTTARKVLPPSLVKPKPMMPLTSIEKLEDEDEIEMDVEASLPESSQRAIILPPETTETDPQLITRCRVRLPSRQTVNRTFLRSEPMSLLFDLIELRLRDENETRPFRIATTFPRRIFTPSEHERRTFVEAGLDQSQEAFVVEFV